MDDKVVDQPQTPAAPPLPVGGGAYGKEQVPTTFLEPEPIRPEVSPELTGVLEPVHEGVDVPYQAQKAGLAPAKEAVPVPTAPTGAVSIPYTADQAISILALHKKITDGARWLAMWSIRQLKKILFKQQLPQQGAI